MPRWASRCFIGGYLAMLALGLGSHGLKYLNFSHPVMYFIVWDMFSGWSAYETRFHILGEGESGRHYVLGPAPWETFRPFGCMWRQDYDVSIGYAYRIAQNTLAQTEHEPIRRIHVVEEAWSKKYNLPEPIWQARFGTEKPVDFRRYWNLRRTLDANGKTLHFVGNWMNCQTELIVFDNPRFRDSVRRGQTLYVSNPRDRAPSEIQPASFEVPARK